MYYADKEGNIYGPRKKLSPTKHHTGYLVVSVKGKQYRCHRFIWEYFNGEIPNDLVIDHINGDKTDNRLENLRLVTWRDNTLLARERLGNWSKNSEENSQAKLTNIEFRELAKDLLNGLSNDEIGSKYNLHPRYVSLIRHKRRWKKQWAILEGSETIET